MKDIIVYSSNTCPYCTLAKKYLEEKGVAYVEKNVQTDKDARAELMSMGHMGVPVLVIDGEQIVGFDKDRLETILDKRS